MCTFFFFSEMFALKKRARGGKTRANAKSLRTSRNRVREFLPRANQSRFFLLFARRGKSRRERLLNYAHTATFFFWRERRKILSKNVIVTFFFPKEHISLSQRERRAWFRKKWRSTRARDERATSPSRPLCSVSADSCITTRWRKGGRN